MGRAMKGKRAKGSAAADLSFVSPERFSGNFFVEHVRKVTQQDDAENMTKCLQAVQETSAYAEQRLAVVRQLSLLLETSLDALVRPFAPEFIVSKHRAAMDLDTMMKCSVFHNHVMEEGEGIVPEPFLKDACPDFSTLREGTLSSRPHGRAIVAGAYSSTDAKYEQIRHCRTNAQRFD